MGNSVDGKGYIREHVMVSQPFTITSTGINSTGIDLQSVSLFC